MEYRKLGESGLKVSRLCLGSLTMGPLQAGLTVEEGASLIVHAVNNGVNFIDTAELYGNYPHLAAALARVDPDGCRVMVATKTYAYTRQQAARSLEKARREMKRERVDIFLLHEQESGLTLQGHRPALAYLQEARQKGIIGAVGISCHTVEAVVAAREFPEIEVIHPIFNIQGLGIRDGGREQMQEAISEARKRGKGIYVMKPLGGGHLHDRAEEALDFLRKLSFVDAVALGMSSKVEVDYALSLFSGEEIPPEIRRRVKKQKRRLHFAGDECQECRQCIASCPQGALSWEGRPVANEEECLYCGYCGASCPFFCLRII